MNEKLCQSRFWSLLWQAYPTAPSVVLCRTPEFEYAATLDVKGRSLDHCCGDGQFALLAWPGQKLAAGCDIDPAAIVRAKKRDIYLRLDVCDVSLKLPYADESFELIFNNSALEHIEDLDAALAEVGRVLSPVGVFAFNVLNHRYFEWWPLDERSQISYREWQPFFHALSLEEWKRRLAKVGLEIASVEGYFARKAARALAVLDYSFSCVYLAKRRHHLVSWYLRFPNLMQRYWRWRLSSLSWKTEPDSGAGYFIRAVK